ncbi:MAG: hypothetical protein U0N90_01340 [Blautia sp.]
MDRLKKKSIDILCKIGKFGVGKSLTLGMYDFDIPPVLRCSDRNVYTDIQTNKRK